MFPRRFGRIAAGLAATAAVLLTAACGSGAGSGAADGDVTTYKIAGYLDYSGPQGNRGPGVEATAKLVLDWWNETKGKELNARLEFLPYDTAYTPAKTVEVHRRAIAEENLVGILGFGSPALLGVKEQLEPDQVPMVLSGPSYTFMSGPGWGFGPMGDLGAAWASGVQYRQQTFTGSGPMKVANVTFDGSSGHDFVESADKILAKNPNVSVVLDEFVPTSATSVGINVDRIIGAQPDVVVIGTTDALQPLLLNELKARGFDMSKVMTSSFVSLATLQGLGVQPTTLDGVGEVTPLRGVDTASDAYKIFHDRAGTFGAEWTNQNQQAMVSMFVLTEAIERALAANPDGITGQSVYEQLDAGTFDGHGLIGEIRFDPTNRRVGGPAEGVGLQFTGGAVDLTAPSVSILPLA
jgi:branched-chain amino acid transport system substrate-binding protein